MSKFTKFIGSLGRTAASDECYTPSNEVWPIYKFLDKEKTYYEATSTHSGSIIKGLEDGGFKVIGNEGRNFFDCGKDDVHDGIVTNPPYSLKDEFISKCYELEKPFALLLPVSACQGQKRGKLYEKFGISMLVYNRRVDFTGKKAPPFGVAWFMGNGFCEPGKLWFVEN